MRLPLAVAFLALWALTAVESSKTSKSFNFVDAFETLQNYLSPTSIGDLSLDSSKAFKDSQSYSRQIANLGTSIFLSRKRFNTSAGFYVPAFSFIVPDQGPLGSPLDLANQAIYGLFVAFTVALMITEPILVTRARPAFTARAREASAPEENAWEESLDRLTGSRISGLFQQGSGLGLDGQKCFEKAICSAFRNPERYGAYGWPFTRFITPKRLDQKPKWFEAAAGVGNLTKRHCGETYKCFFDLLDLAMYYVEWGQAKLSSISEELSEGGDLGDFRAISPVVNAYEEPFYKRKVFNQTFRLCVPIAGFSLPYRYVPGSTIETSNKVLFVVFLCLITAMIFAVPVLFTGTRPFGASPEDSVVGAGGHHHRRAFDATSNRVMHILGLDVVNHLGANAAQCVQRTICESHRKPEEHGVLSFLFRYFFPAQLNNTISYRRALYQEAAWLGKNTSKDCSRAYYCFADVLDNINYFLDYWIASTDNEH